MIIFAHSIKTTTMNKILSIIVIGFLAFPIYAGAQISQEAPTDSDEISNIVDTTLVMTHLDSLVEVDANGDSIFINDVTELPHCKGHSDTGNVILAGIVVLIIIFAGVILAIIFVIICLIVYFVKRKKQRKQNTPPPLPPC